ncbi:hypothetical protein AVEN_221258-1 [Araneus ventricosus]|uniref:Uncharacterized protein n=1 Tax=Araneus ventricosus TaxID=182803 RepID=A0A4Y2LWF9_ARAVE|nr:hypothetical protein AVEN_221258-1 [Araneus ventricosus]
MRCDELELSKPIGGPRTNRDKARIPCLLYITFLKQHESCLHTVSPMEKDNGNGWGVHMQRPLATNSRTEARYSGIKALTMVCCAPLLNLLDFSYLFKCHGLE